MPCAALAETIVTPPGLQGGYSNFSVPPTECLECRRLPEASQEVPAMSVWCHLTSCHQ